MVAKKAQMKIQQMAFMLIGITLFFVLAGLFVLSISLSGLKDSKAALEEKNALLLVSKLANAPEFSCGEAFGTDKSNCVDFDKAFVFKKYYEDYSSFWGISGLEIRKLSNESIECTEENYPDCTYLNVLNSTEDSFDRSNYVILCHKSSFQVYPYDKCELAKLIVRFKNE